jgi:deoxycytidylate deaminase
VTWDARFMALAEHVAGWSKDPSTKVGAVIVSPDRRQLTTGYNGFPQGIADDARHEVRAGRPRRAERDPQRPDPAGGLDAVRLAAAAVLGLRCGDHPERHQARRLPALVAGAVDAVE